jgi:hypothetical protein
MVTRATRRYACQSCADLGSYPTVSSVLQVRRRRYPALKADCNGGDGITSRTPHGDASTQRLVAVDARTVTKLMEQLQDGYVTAVAATAGCLAEFIPRDSYGLDVRFVRPGGPGEEEVLLSAQLKST